MLLNFGLRKQKPAPSKREVGIKPRTKAALINDVLKCFKLPRPNSPVCVATGKWEYHYDLSEANFTMSSKPKFRDMYPPGVANSYFVPFPMAAEAQFKKLKEATGLGYEWNGFVYEKDNMLSVQVVIKMLVRAGYFDKANWMDAPLCALLHLGYYINDQRNVWLIHKSLNQMKKHIALDTWYADPTTAATAATVATTGKQQPKSPPPPPPPQVLAPAKSFKVVQMEREQRDFLQQYLFAFVTAEGRTAFTELLDLSAEMAGLPDSDLTYLTRAAGNEIFRLLKGWSDGAGVSARIIDSKNDKTKSNTNSYKRRNNDNNSSSSKRPVSVIGGLDFSGEEQQLLQQLHHHHHHQYHGFNENNSPTFSSSSSPQHHPLPTPPPPPNPAFLPSSTTTALKPVSIIEVHGHEMRAQARRRGELGAQAARGQNSFAPDVDKVGHTLYDSLLRRFVVPDGNSFADALDLIASRSRDGDLFDEDV